MRKTVLIIEDDREQLNMLKQLVKEVNGNTEVYTAENVSQAYQLLMEKTIDVFLVDIMLDTFPYPGGGTTCDALYMGVPVVSMYGERRSSRFGLSILTNAGIGELAVPTADEYAERAVALAHDWELLDVLHKNLRTMLENSTAMDGRRYVREMETQYEKILQEAREKECSDIVSDLS